MTLAARSSVSMRDTTMQIIIMFPRDSDGGDCGDSWVMDRCMCDHEAKLVMAAKQKLERKNDDVNR